MTDVDLKYEAALDFLYSFIDYSLKRIFVILLKNSTLTA